MCENPAAFFLVPDHFKTQEICIKAVEVDPCLLEDVPDHLKTQEICNEAVSIYPYLLEHVPDYLKTQEMCDKAFWKSTFSLQYVPDWFVTQQQLKLWHDYDDYCNDDKLIEWYEGHKKRKAKKAKIKAELMPIAWYPSRWWDWCVNDDQKKETEKLRKQQIVVLKII